MYDRETQRVDIFGVSRHGETVLSESHGILSRSDTIVFFECALINVSARRVHLHGENADGRRHVVVERSNARRSRVRASTETGGMTSMSLTRNESGYGRTKKIPGRTLAWVSPGGDPLALLVVTLIVIVFVIVILYSDWHRSFVRSFVNSA